MSLRKAADEIGNKRLDESSRLMDWKLKRGNDQCLTFAPSFGMLEEFCLPMHGTTRNAPKRWNTFMSTKKSFTHGTRWLCHRSNVARSRSMNTWIAPSFIQLVHSRARSFGITCLPCRNR